MPLEATIIIVDNSEHSRNGDYIPNRFDAQSETVSMIFTAKTSSNPESSVGLLSMGGAQPEVLTTLTTDFGRVINGMARTKIKGDSHFATALNVGGLALKHRQNKSQHQRIVLFTCSPLPESTTEKDMIKLAKRLKKLAIAVDVIALGAALDPAVLTKLETFHTNIKGPDESEHQSHLVTIPPGPELLSDKVRMTPVLGGDGAGMGGGGGGGEGGEGGSGDASGFEYGVDPSADPELALALRMSMQEEEQRAQREVREREERDGKTELETVQEAAAEGESATESSKTGDGSSVEKKSENDDKKDDGAGPASGDKMDTS